jgi:Holliday junction resolvase-like predicted endonuclease
MSIQQNFQQSNKACHTLVLTGTKILGHNWQRRTGEAKYQQREQLFNTQCYTVGGRYRDATI